MKRWMAVIITFGWCLTLHAQDITPVDVDRTKPEQPRLHYYDKHGEKLAEPVYFLTELDTVQKNNPKSPWPLYNGVTVGANFFDGIMLLAGQSYASFGLHAAVSLHNWFFPTLEAGVGFADNRQEDGTMVYRSRVSPFVKIGIDYNFLYKSTPDYAAGLGVRLGWARPSYEITGASISSDYWHQTSDFSILRQSVNAWYGEALASVRVMIWKGISLGWSIRYRFKMKIPDASNSTPWFIPGYGGSSPVTATFSINYTFGGTREKPADTAEASD